MKSMIVVRHLGRDMVHSAQLESGVGGLLGLYGNSGVGGAEMVLAGGVGISFSNLVTL